MMARNIEYMARLIRSICQHPIIWWLETLNTWHDWKGQSANTQLCNCYKHLIHSKIDKVNLLTSNYMTLNTLQDLYGQSTYTQLYDGYKHCIYGKIDKFNLLTPNYVMATNIYDYPDHSLFTPSDLYSVQSCMTLSLPLN